MRVGLVQLTAGDDPSANLPVTAGLIREAAAQGARLVLTPEVTNVVSVDRDRQRAVLRPEGTDVTLAGLRAEAADLGIWLLIGSLALAAEAPDGRFANRSFLIAPDGGIVARYDKIHMFDVDVTREETFRESESFRPGSRAVVADVDGTRLGLSICYDLRFPRLYHALAEAGADILTVPAAFSPVTGAAHWEVLLRARAIETGCFVLAPAQTGTHLAHTGRERVTHGHSMAIAPWGEVLLDAGTEPGVYLADLDLAAVADARRRVPSLRHGRDFLAPA